MGFEWDENKNLANQKKHGLSFEIAAGVFFDDNGLVSLNRNTGCEERFQVIGRPIDGVMVLFVVFTERGSNGKKDIRIISARKASKEERERYYSEREESERARGTSAPE
jgi:uncharacterized protein